MRLVSEFDQRGDLAEIIDHQRLAHFALDTTRLALHQPVRWINRGLTQQMLKATPAARGPSQFRQPAKVVLSSA
jgi:hypothetical protein